MLEQELAEIFKRHVWTWKIGGKDIVPTEEDFTDALDKVARRLYDEPVGTQIEVGRLIVQKQHDGLYVYPLLGIYI